MALTMMPVATSVWAQSTVTLFGVADAAIQYGTGSVSNNTLVGTGSNEVSRIGMRGTEDLGGGLSASFWLEAGYNIDSGTSQATNTNNQVSGASSAGLTFNRRSTISLSDKWGEVRLGRDYTPQFLSTGAFDAFGGTGIGISETYRGVAAFSPNSNPTAARASNSFGYILPADLNGFYGNAQFYRGENQGGANAGDGNGAGLRGGFRSGPLNVAIATGTTKYLTGDFRMSNIGAWWEFSGAKAMAQISRDNVGVIKARGYQVGVQAPLGNGQARLAYSAYRADNGTTVPETKKLAAGYVYDLSKRTALYTTVIHLTNSGGSRFAVNGAVTAANNSSNGYEFGIRHRF
jgi:predicted porin